MPHVWNSVLILTTDLKNFSMGEQFTQMSYHNGHVVFNNPNTFVLI